MLQQLERHTHDSVQSQKNAVIAVYDTHKEAEDAISQLERTGFSMAHLSIVGRNYHTEEDVIGFYNSGDRMAKWGATGAFWGGIWGLMFGPAFFLLPGVGPLLAAGPIVMLLAGALESAAVVGGLSVLGAALFSIGIPENSIIAYETQIKAGKFLIIARDAKGELDSARAALEATKHQGVNHHS